MFNSVASTGLPRAVQCTPEPRLACGFGERLLYRFLVLTKDRSAAGQALGGNTPSRQLARALSASRHDDGCSLLQCPCHRGQMAGERVFHRNCRSGGLSDRADQQYTECKSAHGEEHSAPIGERDPCVRPFRILAMPPKERSPTASESRQQERPAGRQGQTRSPEARHPQTAGSPTRESPAHRHARDRHEKDSGVSDCPRSLARAFSACGAGMLRRTRWWAP